jgi:hypothetical protein
MTLSSLKQLRRRRKAARSAGHEIFDGRLRIRLCTMADGTLQLVPRSLDSYEPPAALLSHQDEIKT